MKVCGRRQAAARQIVYGFFWLLCYRFGKDAVGARAYSDLRGMGNSP